MNRPTTPKRASPTPPPRTTSFSRSSPMPKASPTTPATPSSTKRSAPTADADRIKVFVRSRGFHKDEGYEKDLAVRMSGATCEVRDPKRGVAADPYKFTFDDCFWSHRELEDPNKPYTSQEDMFKEVGQPLVNNALEGFNSSIIAYGQTGSGKTYSVFGPPNSLGTKDEGLIPRVCTELFRYVNNPPIGTVFRVHVSLIEVYLEEVYDLLNKHTNLKVRGDTTNGFVVSGLKTIPVSKYEDVLTLLKKAEEFKTYGATAMNERSSRAHTIFQLEVRAMTETGTRTSKIVLADLAGCERVKIAKTDSGKPLEQACNINLSLLSLGTCIEAVVSRCRSGQPLTNIAEFRNSTLTKLLRDSIGGNSRTAMLVTVAPHLKDAQLTVQALRFADRAKQIQKHASVNSVLAATDEDTIAVKEGIMQLFEQRKELLGRECELELQSEMLRRKQEDLERKNLQLLEERRKMQEDFDTMSEEQKKAAKAREAEIVEKLGGVEQDLASVQSQRDDMEAKYAAVTAENGEVQRAKDKLEQQVRQLTVALEVQSLEHTDEMRSKSSQIDELQGEVTAVKEQWNDALREHSKLQQEADQREQHLQSMIVSREEDIAELQQKNHHLETLVAAQAEAFSVSSSAHHDSWVKGTEEKLSVLMGTMYSVVDAQRGVSAAAYTEKEKELAAQQERAAGLETQVSSLQETVAKLEAQLQQAAKDVEAADVAHQEHVLSLEERLDMQQHDHRDELEAMREQHAAAMKDSANKANAELHAQQRSGAALLEQFMKAQEIMTGAVAAYEEGSFSNPRHGPQATKRSITDDENNACFYSCQSSPVVSPKRGHAHHHQDPLHDTADINGIN